ncbi:MAG: hypothetical protein ACYTFO_01410, partial [Planctomycetota bacterium]
GDKVAEPSARQVALKTLALAVKLHRAADPDGLWMTYFGASAYEHWARMLHELDYPADTFKPVPEPFWDVYGVGEMARLPNDIVIARSAAATFCETAADDLPEAKDHLLAAAQAYREEVVIAQEAFAVLLEGTDEQKEAWLSDEASREAGVTAVAEMLEKDQLAVRHIQSALAAAAAPVAPPTGRSADDLIATVQREGSKVWIEDVPNMPVGKGREWDGLLKGLHLLITHRGEDVTLEELMALSGDAFHICFGTKWQERTVHMMPTDPLGNAADAMGYGRRWTLSRYHQQFGAMTSQERDASAREYLQEVHSQIDSGMPVLFGGVYGVCGDWRAAVGYDPAEDLICYVGDVDRPYDWTDVYDEKVLSEPFGYWDAQLRGTVRPGFAGGWIGNTAFLLGEKARDVPEAEQVVAALGRAVQLHHASSRPRGADTFYFGARAYEQWARALHELAYPADFERLRGDNPESYDFSTMQYLADQIARGRPAAAAYCERAAGLWPDAKGHLLAAAKAYREEAAIAQEAFGVFLSGSEAQREAWLSDEARREMGVTAIGQMLAKDELAISHIEAALSAIADGTAAVGGPQRMQAMVSTAAFDIPKLADMDAEASPAQWGDRGFRVDILEPYGPRKPVEEFGARFRLGWDETGLWLHATVTDDEFRSAESLEALWENRADLVLLYVIREAGQFARILIEPGMTADQPEPRILTSAEGNDLGVRVTRDKTDTGYVLQALVPWEAVNIDPAEANELRAQVAFLDADYDGEDVIVGGAVWYPGVGTAENTNISYGLRLADQPSPPRTAIVWTGEDRITVTATAEHVGKTVTVVESGRTLAEADLAADDQTGYPTAAIPLPLPALSHPLAQPLVMLGDQPVGSLDAIVLSGNGQQSVSACIQAAARALGKDPDLETILCLSSNAFAPSLNAGEDCTSWWMNQGNRGLRCIDTVAKSVGLDARPVDLPDFTGDHRNPADVKEHHQRVAEIIRERMAAGEIIVTPGGWRARQEHGFVPWCWAGIITEAREDGTILGACLSGRTDNILEDVYSLWAISPAEPTLSAHEADVIALQQAVDRIRGTGRFAAAGNARYGLDAMDAYIEHMRTVPGFCEGCFERAPDRAWTDARDSASAVYHNAEVAASYLRRRIGTFGVEARPHIEEAARRYDRIASLFRPSFEGYGARPYQEWINGDLEPQQRHARVVLVPVRTHLAAAADAMERAIAAEGVEVTPATRPADSAALAASTQPAEGHMLLLEWESQQQMDWEIILRLEDNRFVGQVAVGRDTGADSESYVSDDGRVLTILSGTSSDQGGVIVELAEGAQGCLSVSLGDSYVGDRVTASEFDLAALADTTEQMQVHSEAWRIRNALVRLSMTPQRVAEAREVLTAMSDDRAANIEALLAAADNAEGGTRAKLLFRAAAACTGGCNHGPLSPGGWDRAIAIYERIMDEFAGTDHAINAQWARASSFGCWSPQAGCDALGIGKGDWAKAIEAYDELYQQSADDGSKVEALRRKAELQMTHAEDPDGGRETYRKLLAEFPEAIGEPPFRTSDCWTYRTCEPFRSVEEIQELLATATAPVVGVVARPSEYGFRVDPMTWVENAEGLEAALVRRDVFGTATEADHAVIAAEIERLLADIAADTDRENYGRALDALRLGCDPNRPEIRTAAAEYIRKDLNASGALRRGSLALASMTGWSEGDEPLKSMRAFADAPVPPPGAWDPWIHAMALDTLHAGRELIDVRESVGRWMQVIDEGMDQIACWHKMDVWDLLSSLSRVDDPRARGIVERYIPVLLRTQGPDGGWGRHSPNVFRALVKHGLLDELRTKPPLPAEWRVARTIPAPEGELRTLTFDGTRFWVLDSEAKQAIALSPEDGRELKRLDLDLQRAHGLGWYDGLLAVMTGDFFDANDRPRVVLIDADRERVVKVLPFTNDIWGPSGAVQIGRLLWTSQECWVTTIDIATGQCRGR